MTKLARAIDDEANMGHMAKLNHAMFFEQLKKITLTGVVVFWARPNAFLTTFGDHFPSF